MVEIKSHTADVRLRVTADSLEGLFSEGMKGLYAILTPAAGKIKKDAELSVSLTGRDRTVLFIHFLNEVLSHSLMRKCVYDHISSFQVKGDQLSIHLKGYCIRSFHSDVKAVTFHEAEVQETPEGSFQTMIILDI